MINNIVKNNNWVLVDAKDKVLGRLASKIASILMGKNKVNYNYNHIFGDSIIVVNASFIKFTGNKFNNKLYYKHSGYPGGFKVFSLKDLYLKDPSNILKIAIKNMLPRNKLRKIFMKRIRIYSYDIHPHLAQKPININI